MRLYVSVLEKDGEDQRFERRDKIMKMPCIVWLEIIFLFFFQLTGWGADWRFFSESPRGACFYDAESVENISKNIIKVCTKINTTQEEVERWTSKFGDKYREFKYEEENKEINCYSKRARLLTVTAYNREGGVIDAVDFSNETEWDRVVSGSVNGALMQIICKKHRSGMRKLQH